MDATAYPLRREGGTARASWQVDPGMSWDDYAEWLPPRLGEYRVAIRGPEIMRLTRPLEGDLYALTLRPKPSGQTLVVEAAFEASPF